MTNWHSVMYVVWSVEESAEQADSLMEQVDPASAPTSVANAVQQAPAFAHAVQSSASADVAPTVDVVVRVDVDVDPVTDVPLLEDPPTQLASTAAASRQVSSAPQVPAMHVFSALRNLLALQFGF
jgi:hypothetical protein